jgi:putative ABC transport system substrate-binding protein
VLAVLGAASTPFAIAQARKVWRVGFLSSELPNALRYQAFLRGMRDAGYVEGKNLRVEVRYAEGDRERLSRLAAELAESKVDVIVTAGSYAAAAAKAATARIPIVMGAASDPVSSGLVASLARPGGNVTGLSLNAVDVSAKHLELVKTVLPGATLVGVLNNPAIAAHLAVVEELEAAAKSLGIATVTVQASSLEEIQRGFETLKGARVQAIIVVVDAFFNSQSRRIAELAARNRLPSVFALRESVEAGGLLSYGQDLADSYYRAAAYVDKIFKGARPGDLPIEQPLKFDLAVNLRTAKALGVTIPRSLLLSADYLVE